MNETCKELIYRFLDELKRTYYSSTSICRYQKPLNALLEYCEEKCCAISLCLCRISFPQMVLSDISGIC